MEKNQIRKEIANLINSIKEHSDNIGDKEHIPQLELELILHKIEKLYQKSIVFNHLNTVQPFAQVVEDKKDIPSPLKAEVKVAEAAKPEPEKKEELKPVDLFGAELAPPVEKLKQEKRVEKKEEKLEEKKFDKKQDIPLAKIQRPSIADIRSAIGINDKFQYANELFGGEMQEYEIAIQQLNTAETMESASEYFMSLQQLYNWNNEHETVKRLFDLVERRYS